MRSRLRQLLGRFVASYSLQVPSTSWYNNFAEICLPFSCQDSSAPDTQPPPRPTRTNEPQAKKAKKQKGQHNVENGYHTTSRDGTPLCIRFNLGQCQSASKGLSCPADSSRYHLCSKCLRPGHGANVCQQEIHQPTGRKTKGGGKGGKGGKPPY